MDRWMTRGLTLLGLLVLVLETTGQVQKPAKIPDLKVPKQIATPKPQITDVVLKYANGDFIALDVIGTNLGTFSPTKRLFIDGIQADATEVVGWTANKIEVDEEVFFEITNHLIWWDHTYQWSIRDGVTVLSNVFSKRFPLHIEGILPSDPAVGAIIEISGDGLSHPGDLKIGDTTVTGILSREMHRIRARVPLMHAGTYEVSIRQGGTIISEKRKITVH